MKLRTIAGAATLCCLAFHSAQAAIAFNAAADLGNVTATSLTAAYTAGSGTNRFLFVFVEGDVVGGSDDCSGSPNGVTYNGTAMTFLAKVTTGAASSNRIIYTFGLAAPTSGSHNVVATCGSSHFIAVMAADYTGVVQTTPAFDGSQATSNGSTGTTISATFTTTVANDWVIGVCVINAVSTTFTYGGSYVERKKDAANAVSDLFDSNGALAAGSQTATCNTSTNATLQIIAGGISPAGGAVPERAKMGVGQ